MESKTNYEEVVRRAEMFNYIVDLVRSYPDEEFGEGTTEDPPTIPAKLSAQEAALVLPRSEDILPRIDVVDRRVVCNGVTLDLARRPLTLRLFQAFCGAPDQQLTREEILQHIYLLDDLPGRSERFVDSVYTNGVKLISRTRRLAARHFGRAVNFGVEWFVHDQEHQVWCLYRLRTPYLMDKLR